MPFKAKYFVEEKPSCQDLLVRLNGFVIIKGAYCLGYVNVVERQYFPPGAWPEEGGACNPSQKYCPLAPNEMKE